MTRFTHPSYCDPLKEKGYIHYQTRHDRRCNCLIAAIVAFSAGVAVCALIQVYMG